MPGIACRWTWSRARKCGSPPRLHEACPRFHDSCRCRASSSSRHSPSGVCRLRRRPLWPQRPTWRVRRRCRSARGRACHRPHLSVPHGNCSFPVWLLPAATFAAHQVLPEPPAGRVTGSTEGRRSGQLGVTRTVPYQEVATLSGASAAVTGSLIEDVTSDGGPGIRVMSFGVSTSTTLAFICAR